MKYTHTRLWEEIPNQWKIIFNFFSYPKKTTTTTTIIIIWFLALQSVFYNPSSDLYSRPGVRESSDYMYSMFNYYL